MKEKESDSRQAHFMENKKTNSIQLRGCCGCCFVGLLFIGAMSAAGVVGVAYTASKVVEFANDKAAEFRSSNTLPPTLKNRTGAYNNPYLLQSLPDSSHLVFIDWEKR